MGWLWSSAPSSEDKTSAPVKETPPTISTASTSTSTSAPTTTPSSNSNADPEIQKFLELFEAEKNTKPSPPTQGEESSSTSTISSWLSLKKSTRPSAPMPSDIPPRDVLSEALLPTDMSCRQAFDQAWACNSMGGQFNAVYRYGEMKSCSENWDDFWFCMRTRGYSAEQREKAIKEHYRAKEFIKYGPGKASSEDIWESRDELLPVGTTFNTPVE